jgi:phage shock protein C
MQPRGRLQRRIGMELRNRIYRSQRERIFAGVAGGLAEYFDIDPTIVRLLWVLAVVTTGPLALFLYLLCAMIIPRDPESRLI